MGLKLDKPPFNPYPGLFNQINQYVLVYDHLIKSLFSPFIFSPSRALGFPFYLAVLSLLGLAWQLIELL